ncbi:MAG: hypothetical protein KDE31_37490, partial [Caldilineaceae bacterium]|nr:hypothetical protein [Caldilineaceae bacterium]
GVPISAIMVMSFFQPGYMNARHLSLLVGFTLLAAAGGVALLWRYQRLVSGAVTAILLIGVCYSTYNYFTAPAYSKDDYRALGHYLESHLLPGDLLLVSPPFSWRIFDYYLPVDQINRAAAHGVDVAVGRTPLLNAGWPATFAQLADASQHYRRIWLARSGTHPFLDPEGRVKSWLIDHSAVHLQEIDFHSSNSFLSLDLFLPAAPVAEGMAPAIMYPLHATFGDQIELVFYDLAPPIGPTNALPVTLYWQITAKTDQHYKYILRLVEVTGGQGGRVIETTEREPYDGSIPTTVWDPGKTIIEYSEVPLDQHPLDPTQHYHLTLQLYHADTFEKLPVTAKASTVATVDEQTITLPMPDGFWR